MPSLGNDLTRLDDQAARFLEQEHRLFIDGEWVTPSSGKFGSVVDPSSGEEVSRIALSNQVDVDNAVASAKRAFEYGPWRTMAPEGREALLWELARLIDEDAAIIGQVETVDNGMPVFVATNLDVRGAAGVMRHMAGWASKIFGKTKSIVAPFPDTEFTAYTLKEPVGVVAAIVPWNVPFMLAVWKAAPALAAGCTLVIKPAQESSLSALMLADLVRRAGFPAGVVNVITGSGEIAGQALVEHKDVSKISFTGSTAVGKHINKVATDTVKRVTLELGGKSPNIVFADANLQEAIAGSAMAIFANSGQICVSGSRLYVHRNVFEEVVDGIAEFSQRLNIGAGLDPASQLGPLTTYEHRQNVVGYIESGVSDGAEIRVGGKSPNHPGFYLEPTVLTNTTQDMRVVQEEIFGPVLVASAFDELEEAVSLSNDTRYGLSAYVWTSSLSTAHTMVDRLRAGKILVNNEGFPHPAMPEGGFKESGFGKDLGYEAVEGYLETKSIIMRTR